MAVKLFEFEAAVRGCHYYTRYWVPVENQELDCLHEVDNDNPYDYFAIKTCKSARGKIVSHLPMDISRPTKFLLQRGAVIKVTLSSTNYRKSSLVQGGLEIRNRQIIEKFKDTVDVLFDEPDVCAVLVHFLTIRLRFPKIHEKEPVILSLPPILIDK